MTESRERALNAMHRSLLRYTLGVHFSEKLASRALMERTGLAPLRKTPSALADNGFWATACAATARQTDPVGPLLLRDLDLFGAKPSSTMTCLSIFFLQRVSVKFIISTHKTTLFSGNKRVGICRAVLESWPVKDPKLRIIFNSALSTCLNLIAKLSTTSDFLNLSIKWDEK